MLNGGRSVSFPAAGQQTRFHQQFGAILSSAGLI
jgi:hypothetical protein